MKDEAGQRIKRFNKFLTAQIETYLWILAGAELKDSKYFGCLLNSGYLSVIRQDREQQRRVRAKSNVR